MRAFGDFDLLERAHFVGSIVCLGVDPDTKIAHWMFPSGSSCPWSFVLCFSLLSMSFS